MKSFTLVLALFISLLVGQSASADERQSASDEDTAVVELVKKVTSPQLNWEKRFEAEEKLENMASAPVLFALIPEASKGMPSGGIWNGFSSAEGNKVLPPNWQVFYAVHRLWFHHYMKSLRENGVPLASVGKRLVDYLPIASSKGWILQELGASGRSESFWIDEAEQPVVALFRDAKTDEHLRAVAMQCLLRNTGQKYYGEIKAVIRAYPENTDKQLYFKAERLRDIIQDALRKRDKNPKQPDTDSELLRVAFSLLPKLEKVTEGGGYFLALTLETYVGQEFKANQSDPKYKGEHGLTPSFFADTTLNALKWWERNQNKYKL